MKKTALKSNPIVTLYIVHRAAVGEQSLKFIRVKSLEGLRNIFCSIFSELFTNRFHFSEKSSYHIEKVDERRDIPRNQ